MQLEKFKPWNWFKHEQSEAHGQLPIRQKPNEAYEVQHPVSAFMQLHRDMDRLMDQVFQRYSGFPGLQSERQPTLLGDLIGAGPQLGAVDISARDKQYSVTFNVPGLSQEDLSIERVDDTLVIRGQVADSQEQKDKHFYRLERTSGSFQRTLALPDDAVVEEIQASLKDGLLSLTIPRQESQPSNVRKIPIH